MAGAASGGGGGSAVKAGEAFVEIAARATGFDKVIGGLQKRMKSVGSAMAKAGAGIAAAGAAAAAPLIAMFTSAVEKGSAFADLSGRLGTTSEEISALGYAAEQSGVSMETLETSLGKMQKTISEGAQKGDVIAGLDLKSLLGGDLETQLMAVANTISELENAEDRAAVAMEIFGKGGRALLPMLANGAAGIEEMTDEARKLGFTYSNLDAEQADKIGDSTHRLWKSLAAIKLQVGKAILPMAQEIETFSLAVSGAITPLLGFIKENGKVIVAVAAAGVGLVVFGTALGAIGLTIMAASAAIGGLIAAVGFLLSPIGLVVAGVALLSTGLVLAIADATNFGEALGDAFEGIKDAFAAGDWELIGKLAFAGLELEWTKIVNLMTKKWRDFRDEVSFDPSKSNIANDAFVAATFVTGDAPNALQALWDDFSVNVLGTSKTMTASAGASTVAALSDANANKRAIAEAAKTRDDDLKAKENELKNDLEGLKAQAAEARKAAEWEKMNQDFLREEMAAVKIANVANAVGTEAGAVKGAFASQAGAGSFAFADSGKDIAKNTKRAADGIEDLARAVDRNQLVVSA